MDALEVIGGIVAVGRIAVDLRHLQDTGGGRLLLAANRRGIEADQRVRLVEEPDGLSGLVDFDSVRLSGCASPSAGRVHDDDVSPAWSKRCPGLSAASSASLMWNFSASPSRELVKPSFGICFISSIFDGSFGRNGPATSCSAIV